MSETLLITPGELKQWSSKAAAASPLAIEYACRAVTSEAEGNQKGCGRKLIQQTHTAEEYPGTGDNWLRLRNSPVTSVSEVLILDAAVDLTTVKIVDADTGLLWRPGTFGARPAFAPPFLGGLADDRFFDRPERFDGSGVDFDTLSATPSNVKVTYVGGYPRGDVRLGSLVVAALKRATKILSNIETEGLSQEKLAAYSYTKFAADEDPEENAWWDLVQSFRTKYATLGT